MAPLPDIVDRLRAALADRYAIERETGRGGMATVYRATDLKHDRAVALKVLRPELAAAMGATRFLREISILARLNHPNVLPLLDSGEVDGLVFYVMPFITGESLRERLTRETQLPVEDALRITREVADALAYAHAQGVIHRDVKPENILLESGHAVVADFGIARSIRAGVDVSSAGLAIGTPAYMSPEQWEGGTVDGRSDLYSLGCVLYEMLSGAPPFVAPKADQVANLHRMETPRPLRATRPTITGGVQQIVDRLLAKSPADRQQSAQELVDSLTGSATPLMLTVPRRRTGRRTIPLLLAAAAVLGVAYWRTRPAPNLDPDRFVVLPFRHRGGGAPPLVNGDMCESLIYEAMGRWRDLPVANSLLVRDAITQRGGQVTTLADGLALARGLRAGRLIWGEVWETGDTTVVRAAVYDVGAGRPLHEHTARMRQGSVGPEFTALTDSLVIRSAGLTSRAETGIGTQSFTALREFALAQAAVARWDLAEAVGRLEAAVAADPAYPQAHLHLAQIALWQKAPATMWRGHAAAAVAGAWLSARDSALARALLDLADRRYQESCKRYHERLARDSLDFAAWYGLGECQARDRTVVRDAASPSGWRFVSSGHAAVEAYVRALSLVPSVHVVYQGAALGRLQDILFAGSERVRFGTAVTGGDTLRFAAFPGLSADTLSFVPWPVEQVFGGRAEALPVTRADALSRNRGVLRRLAETWIRAYPRSMPALETYVVALEVAGDLGATVQGMPTALQAAARMRELAPTEVYRRDAMLWQTRLLVKQHAFGAARALADSLLRGVDRTTAQAHRLAGAAALTGRVHLAADLLESFAPIWPLTAPQGDPVEVPVPLRADALRLLAYASFGAPADSIGELVRRVEHGVATFVTASRADAEAALRDRAAQLAFPLVEIPLTQGSYLFDLQRAARAGDTALVATRFAAIATARQGQRPGDVALDMTVAEAVIRLAVADTAGAAAELGRALDGLATFGSMLLAEVPSAAAIGRAMALRADLAAAAGDSAGAATWARAVTILWGDADPPLAPVVARMRFLGGRN